MSDLTALYLLRVAIDGHNIIEKKAKRHDTGCANLKKTRIFLSAKVNHVINIKEKHCYHLNYGSGGREVFRVEKIPPANSFLVITCKMVRSKCKYNEYSSEVEFWELSHGIGNCLALILPPLCFSL